MVEESEQWWGCPGQSCICPLGLLEDLGIREVRGFNIFLIDEEPRFTLILKVSKILNAKFLTICQNKSSGIKKLILSIKTCKTIKKGRQHICSGIMHSRISSELNESQWEMFYKSIK